MVKGMIESYTPCRIVGCCSCWTDMDLPKLHAKHQTLDIKHASRDAMYNPKMKGIKWKRVGG